MELSDKPLYAVSSCACAGVKKPATMVHTAITRYLAIRVVSPKTNRGDLAGRHCFRRRLGEPAAATRP